MSLLRELLPIIARTHPAFYERAARLRPEEAARAAPGSNLAHRGVGGGVLAVQPEELRAAATRMRQVADDLDRIDAAMRDSLGGMSVWRGLAAEGFAETWAAYQATSARHRSELEELRKLVDAAAAAVAGALSAADDPLRRVPKA